VVGKDAVRDHQVLHELIEGHRKPVSST
jgi:hypothetical protein